MYKVYVNGENLKNCIIRRNLSVDAFAQLVGTSGDYLGELIAGKRAPHPRTRAKLMEASGLPFDDLFSSPHLAARE